MFCLILLLLPLLVHLVQQQPLVVSIYSLLFIVCYILVDRHHMCELIGENRLEKLSRAQLDNVTLTGHAIFWVPMIIVAGNV